MSPICPICGDKLDYDEELDIVYDDTSCHIKWRGWCIACNCNFTWWENYNLVSITDMEQEKELE